MLLVEPTITGPYHSTCNLTLLFGFLNLYHVEYLSHKNQATMIMSGYNYISSLKSPYKSHELRFSFPKLKLLSKIFLISNISFFLYSSLLSIIRLVKKKQAICYLSCNYLLTPFFSLIASLFSNKVSIVIHKPTSITSSALKSCFWSLLLLRKNINLICISDKAFRQLETKYSQFKSQISVYYPPLPLPINKLRQKNQNFKVFVPPNLRDKIREKYSLGGSQKYKFNMDSLEIWSEEHRMWVKAFTPSSNYGLSVVDYINQLCNCTHMLIDTDREGLSYSGYRLDAFSFSLKVIETACG